MDNIDKLSTYDIVRTQQNLSKEFIHQYILNSTYNDDEVTLETLRNYQPQYFMSDQDNIGNIDLFRNQYIEKVLMDNIDVHKWLSTFCVLILYFTIYINAWYLVMNVVVDCKALLIIIILR